VLRERFEPLLEFGVSGPARRRPVEFETKGRQRIDGAGYRCGIARFHVGDRVTERSLELRKSVGRREITPAWGCLAGLGR
jgi:hypothetical protein